MQTGSERRLLFCTIAPYIEKICSFYVVWKSIRVPLSLLWPGSRTPTIYQIAENTHGNFTQNKHQGYNLSGRYVIDGSNTNRNFDSHGHSYFSLTTSRLYPEYGEVNSRACTEVGISGAHGGLQGNVSVLASRKINQNNQSVSTNVQPRSYINLRVNKTHGLMNSTVPAVLPCSNSDKIFTKTTDLCLENAQKLPKTNFLERKLKNGAGLVDKQPGTFEWRIYNSAPKPSLDSNRCLKERM